MCGSSGLEIHSLFGKKGNLTPHQSSSHHYHINLYLFIFRRLNTEVPFGFPRPVLSPSLNGLGRSVGGLNKYTFSSALTGTVSVLQEMSRETIVSDRRDSDTFRSTLQRYRCPSTRELSRTPDGTRVCSDTPVEDLQPVTRPSTKIQTATPQDSREDPLVPRLPTQKSFIKGNSLYGLKVLCVVGSNRTGLVKGLSYCLLPLWVDDILF